MVRQNIESVSGTQQDPEILLRDPPQIEKPFYRSSEEIRQEAVWNTPTPCCQPAARVNDFSFERPKPSDTEKLASAVGVHQAEYMKKIVLEKQREIQMLQRQLTKCNKENVTLIRTLEGFKWKNYAALYREITLLRNNNYRLMKENVILRGNARKAGNIVLNKLSLKERLDAKHARRIQSEKP